MYALVVQVTPYLVFDAQLLHCNASLHNTIKILWHVGDDRFHSTSVWTWLDTQQYHALKVWRACTSNCVTEWRTSAVFPGCLETIKGSIHAPSTHLHYILRPSLKGMMWPAHLCKVRVPRIQPTAACPSNSVTVHAWACCMFSELGGLSLQFKKLLWLYNAGYKPTPYMEWAYMVHGLQTFPWHTANSIFICYAVYIYIYPHAFIHICTCLLQTNSA